MRIGFIGMGKLGLPVAVAIGTKNHDIVGYDINPNINSHKKPYECLYTQEKDENLNDNIIDIFNKSTLRFVDTMEECLLFGEIIFLAIQTPHNEKYGGQCPMPEERCDFDYTWLINCMTEINNILNKINQTKIIVLISTVLPGTLRKYILPIISNKICLCYNPFFIAMGTVIYDFFNPEFILLGKINDDAELQLTRFYKTITNSPIFSTSLENAELIKVSYNTFITTKVVLANNIMEMCHYLPNTDVDQISNALALATNRLISPAYLRGGMGDGGGCHPRDNIAMSWLSNKLGLKYNYYDFIMKKREEQSLFLAKIIIENKEKYNLPVVILGYAFKPETNLIDGSTAILLKNQLNSLNIDVEMYDPFIDKNNLYLDKKIYFIGCKHNIFTTYIFSNDSVIIDPHRYLNKYISSGVIYIPIGIGSKL
jgi:UDPglucose 6-dehydrogenase